MSIALMTKVWPMAIPSTPKLVLLSLADQANDAGVCWPSQPQIATRCSISDRAVKPHRIVSDHDIFEACLWRLAGCQAEVIEASTARVAKFIKSGVPLESDQPEVAAAMAALKRPGDRRSGWSALMAVTALYADSQGYTCMNWKPCWPLCKCGWMRM